MEDSYLTISSESRTEIKVKGSRFIGRTFLVGSVEAAHDRLATVRKKEHQASHHCYAHIIGLRKAQEFKYSDDGEPSGTAGRPIYDLLAGRKITNVLLVVTRYFGGTKLGTGGLARAYTDAARAVMNRSGSRENFITRQFRFDFDFSLYDRWQREIHRLGAVVTDSRFSDRVMLQVEIRESLAEQLVSAFTELTSGKGEVEETGSQ